MRDLHRDTITSSSRVMLPVYFVVSTMIGAAYTFGDPSRTSNPALDTVRGIMPIRNWGLFFLLIAVLEALAWWVHSREVMVLVLRISCSALAVWTFGLLCALIELKGHWPFFDFAPGASIVGVVLWGFVPACHVATLQSLTKDSPRRQQ